MAFCPNCGLDLRQLPADAGALDRPAARDDPTPAVPRVTEPPSAGARYERLREPPGLGRFLGPGLLVVLLLLIAASWLAGLGPFAGSGGSGGPLTGGTESATPSSPFLPAVTAQPSFSIAPGFTAPPVGLTILSPADGAVVGAKEVTVIGTAPPGLRITQDISLGFDRHATADGTGHWAIGLELAEGENQLKFRIGDDPSTTQTIRVFYLAPAGE
jgi:hypothetical protein